MWERAGVCQPSDVNMVLTQFEFELWYNLSIKEAAIMQFSLKAPDGTVIESYQKDRKEFIRIAGMEYEVYSPVNEFDSDPEIRQMIEASERDIKYGKVYSTDDIVEAIKRGEL
jgi:hypothetical protein